MNKVQSHGRAEIHRCWLRLHVRLLYRYVIGYPGMMMDGCAAGTNGSSAGPTAPGSVAASSSDPRSLKKLHAHLMKARPGAGDTKNVKQQKNPAQRLVPTDHKMSRRCPVLAGPCNTADARPHVDAHHS